MKAIITVAILLVMITCGCSRRTQDVEGIHRIYISFRQTLIATNSKAAEAFITDGVEVLLPTKIFSTYDDVLKPEFALNSKSHIYFDKARGDHAYLWPTSPPRVGTYGIGVTKETNTWKVNGEFMTVSH